MGPCMSQALNPCLIVPSDFLKNRNPKDSIIKGFKMYILVGNPAHYRLFSTHQDDIFRPN